MHRFSARLRWQEPSNPLSQLLAEKRRSGAQILDLTESNPTRADLPYHSHDLLATLADPLGLTYEPSPKGREQARQCIQEYYRDRGSKVDPAHIILTASTSEAYSYLFQILADPGDEILSPQPSYPLFEYLAGLVSVTIQQYPLRYDGAWHVDFGELEHRISPRTRALVVVNPNNPTGSFLKQHELERLEEIALRHSLAIISDEVFCDYGFPVSTNAANSIWTDRVTTLVGKRRALTFSMSGLSKVAGLPQMKLGWIAASGPGAEQSMEALELVADTYLSVATPVQVALPELLRLSAPVRVAIQERTMANLVTLAGAVANSRGTLLNTEGGWYATLQVPHTLTAEAWSLQLLAECDVLVQPGYFFDFESEAFLVLSLLTKPAPFLEGVRRLMTFL